MFKRIISALLAFVILTPLFALDVSIDAKAAGGLTASDEIVALIKRFEGFTKYVRKLSTRSYIGYGTTCKPGDYPNGITEAEAEALLRKELSKIGSKLDQFLEKNNISLTQNQYDALLSFSYNLGTGWLGYTNRIRTYLINGVKNYTDMEIINAFAIWCHVGKTVNTHLIERKLIEASVFLYADYSKNSPDKYRYIIFDPGAGEVETDVVIYEYGKPYGKIQEAVRKGYWFAGWITEDGSKVTPGQIAEKNLKVTASWSSEPITLPVEQEPDVPASTGLYRDVSESDWYYTYISDLSQNNVISGYPDGSFRPNAPVTCGEALKLIMLAAGYEPQKPTGSHWASGFLELALSAGLVDEGEITSLEAPISRCTVARIAARALGLSQSENDSPFADTSDGYVLSLYEIGIIQGSNVNGTVLFLPEKNMSRSEISAVIWRISSVRSRN